MSDRFIPVFCVIGIALCCYSLWLEEGRRDNAEPEPVKCTTVDKYEYTPPPQDKRVPLPPGPMEPSKWG